MMKQLFGIMILAGILAVQNSAAAQGLAGPQVQNVDQRISINADDITLGRLFQLWDQATAMHSTVPRELANRTLSVHFTGLSVSDALRRIFDGQQLGYVLVEGIGVVVTELVQTGSTFETPSESSDNEGAQVTAEPAAPETARMKPEQPPPPKVVRTPFGPIVYPNGSTPPQFTQLPPVDSAPPPPFFMPEVIVMPPSGAPNGPADNRLFGPLPIYPDAPLLPPNLR